MKRLDSIRVFLQGDLFNLLAVVLILIIASGLVFFYTSVIDPGVRNRDKLIAQLATVRKALAETRTSLEQNPADLEKQLTNTQARLAASKSSFLTESQASQIADALYQEANASHVVITDLQTQSAMTQTNRSAVTVAAMRLEAHGDSHQLVDFVVRMKEASQKGVVVGNLNIAQDKTTAKLTMDITLYTSPVIPGDPRVAALPTPNKAPTVAPTQPLSIPASSAQPTEVIRPATPPVPPIATPIPPTPVPPTPTPQSAIYVVRAGDTLFSLARRFSTTVEAIITANRLSTFDIRIGQSLLIPNH